MKKIGVGLITFFILLGMSLTVVRAEGFSVDLSADKSKIQAGDTVVLTASLHDIDIGTYGMDLLLANLSYDTNVFETITQEDIQTVGQWGGLLYNANKNKLILERQTPSKNNEDFLQIKMHVKKEVQEKQTTIHLVEPQSTNGNSDISGTEGSITLKVQKTGMNVWGVVGIVLVILLAGAGIGYGIYRKKRKEVA